VFVLELLVEWLGTTVANSFIHRIAAARRIRGLAQGRRVVIRGWVEGNGLSPGQPSYLAFSSGQAWITTDPKGRTDLRPITRGGSLRGGLRLAPPKAWDKAPAFTYLHDNEEFNVYCLPWDSESALMGLALQR
jgi:hypothetical protein